MAAGTDDAGKVFGATDIVNHGDTIGFGEQEISVLSVPCHTRGHVAYLSEGNLFSGDTLFVAGCGRFFEGEASEMDQALNSVFASLPKSTRVFCGHEYTVANLRFAASVEPDNEAVAAKLEWAVAQEEEGVSTVPSTIHEELETNPFMRVRLAEMQTRLGASDAVEAMRILRERKTPSGRHDRNAPDCKTHCLQRVIWTLPYPSDRRRSAREKESAVNRSPPTREEDASHARC